MCTETIPSQWIYKKWVSCNLEISRPCHIDFPYGCVGQSCDDTILCSINQCEKGTHLCQDNRECIFNPDWSYTCGDCPNTTIFQHNISFFQQDGSFKCTQFNFIP